MDYFDQSFDATDRVEGGWGYHPDDPGEETYRGIARAFHEDFAGWPIIDHAKSLLGTPWDVDEIDAALSVNPELDQMVRDFYRAEYWNPIKGDALAATEPRIAAEVYDTAVNMGVGVAGRYLQRALNVLDRNTLTDITVDGKIGPQTLGRLVRLNSSSLVLVKMLNILQGYGYIERAEDKSVKEKFIHGWFIHRVEI